MAVPVRRDVGRELDRDECVAAHAPLRHAARGAGLDRVERPDERSAQPRRHLSRAPHDGRLLLLAKPPVFVEAVGTQITEPISWDQGTLEHEPMLAGPSAHLWSRTDVRHTDVDVALLYDGFSFNCLSWIEALGFCGIGEGKDFVDGGARIALDGELPLNPHGGQLSAGRTHGYGFVHEAAVQLRGEAGVRQVHGARCAVVSTGGGTPGGCLLLRSA
jgi:Thiolase C-terminal domain-like